MGALELRLGGPAIDLASEPFSIGVPFMRFFSPELQDRMRIRHKGLKTDAELLATGKFDSAFPAEEEPLAEAEYGLLLPNNQFLAVSRIIGYENILWHMLDYTYSFMPARFDNLLCLETLAPLACFQAAGKQISCRDLDVPRILTAAEKLGVQYDRYHIFEAKVEYLRKR
ncbi:hypothetical protein HY642_02815 [Candidatus Woesearchaeota archaeon]|nr:hypothetical protein [Candidatus Woesearchaeota archaeon]